MPDELNTVPTVSALFDMSFTRFITIGVVRIIYIIALVLIPLF